MSLHGDVPITCYGPSFCRRAWHGKTHCDMRTNLCTALAPPTRTRDETVRAPGALAEIAKRGDAGFFRKHGRAGPWIAGLALLLVVAILLSRRRR